MTITLLYDKKYNFPMKSSKDLKFIIAAGLDITKKTLKRWHGEPIILPKAEKISEEVQSILSVNQVTAERIVSILNGQPPIQGSFHDFAKPLPEVDKHPFVLLRDTNKHLVWSQPEFFLQRIKSAEWLYARCGHYRATEGALFEGIELVQKLSDFCSRGESLLSANVLYKQIPEYLLWIESMSPNKVVFDYKFSAISLIGSLILDWDIFQRTFASQYQKEIIRVIESYETSPNAMKPLIRKPCGEEFTHIANMAMELDLLKDPVALLDREWTVWPLEYNGFQPTRLIRTPFLYELATLYASNTNIDYARIVLPLAKEEAFKMTRLRHAMFIKIKKKRYQKPFWAAEAIQYIVDGFKELTHLTEYEILRIVRGSKRVIRDDKQGFIKLSDDEMPLYFALKELGLKPYRPSLRHARSIYGLTHLKTGFSLEIISEPHVIHYLGPEALRKLKPTSPFHNHIQIWTAENRPVMTLWWDLHMGKPRRITPNVVRKCFISLAKKGVPLAQKICAYWNSQVL